MGQLFTLKIPFYRLQKLMTVCYLERLLDLPLKKVAKQTKQGRSAHLQPSGSD